MKFQIGDVVRIVCRCSSCGLPADSGRECIKFWTPIAHQKIVKEVTTDRCRYWLAFDKVLFFFEDELELAVLQENIKAAVPPVDYKGLTGKVSFLGGSR